MWDDDDDGDWDWWYDRDDFDNWNDDDPFGSEDASNDVTSSSVNADAGDKTMVGTQFTTGNSTVKGLPVGAILQVVGQGRVEVLEVPSKSLTVSDISAGDRIVTEFHGTGTVVRPSTRFGSIEGYNPETQVLYVSDEDPVVRRVNASDVSFE